jgi:hypothetical protein
MILMTRPTNDRGHQGLGYPGFNPCWTANTKHYFFDRHDAGWMLEQANWPGHPERALAENWRR